MGGEMRQNRATRQWVIYSPARRKRPKDLLFAVPETAPLPARAADCPFCPGNEDLLGEVTASFSGDRGGLVRVIPNKYPALVPEGTTDRRADGVHISMDGFGRHEVIVESPRHDLQPPQMSKEEMDLIVESYHRRSVETLKGDGSMMAIVFRNYGRRAGASLVHPHSQLIATAVVPAHIRWKEEQAERYFDAWGRCVYCDILEHELRDGLRVVMENGSFAAEVPFETWIVPKTHGADFGGISEKEKSDFSDALSDVLGRLHGKLKDPDYNFVIHSSARYRTGEPQLHWHLQIRPRVVTMAGFEIGSGMSINPSIPEEDAAFLRER